MKPDLQSLLLTELRTAVARALKDWLDANKAEFLTAIRGATAGRRSDATPELSPQKPRFLTLSDVAKRWQVHPVTVRRMVRDKRLPGIWVGRSIRVPLPAVEAAERRGNV